MAETLENRIRIAGMVAESYGAKETAKVLNEAASEAREMLEALRMLMERLEYLGEYGEVWTVDARAAIAKAEGH